MPAQNLTRQYEEENSDDDISLKKYIKVCVQDELDNILKNKYKNSNDTNISIEHREPFKLHSKIISSS